MRLRLRMQLGACVAACACRVRACRGVLNGGGQGGTNHVQCFVCSWVGESGGQGSGGCARVGRQRSCCARCLRCTSLHTMVPSSKMQGRQCRRSYAGGPTHTSQVHICAPAAKCNVNLRIHYTPKPLTQCMMSGAAMGPITRLTVAISSAFNSSLPGYVLPCEACGVRHFV